MIIITVLRRGWRYKRKISQYSIKPHDIVVGAGLGGHTGKKSTILCFGILGGGRPLSSLNAMISSQGADRQKMLYWRHTTYASESETSHPTCAKWHFHNKCSKLKYRAVRILICFKNRQILSNQVFSDFDRSGFNIFQIPIFFWQTPVEDVPLAIAPFQGRALVGVGKLLRIYDMGKKKLLRKCENKVSSLLPHSIYCSCFRQKLVYPIGHNYQITPYIPM